MRAGQYPARPPGSRGRYHTSQKTLIPREDLADVPDKKNDISQVNAARLTLTVDGTETGIDIDLPSSFFSQFPELGASQVPAELGARMSALLERVAS